MFEGCLHEHLSLKRVQWKLGNWKVGPVKSSPHSSWASTMWLPVSKKLDLCSSHSLKHARDLDCYCQISAFQRHAKSLLFPRLLWSAFLLKILSIKIWTRPVEFRIMCLVIMPRFFHSKVQKLLNISDQLDWSAWNLEILCNILWIMVSPEGFASIASQNHLSCICLDIFSGVVMSKGFREGCVCACIYLCIQLTNQKSGLRSLSSNAGWDYILRKRLSSNIRVMFSQPEMVGD